MTAVEWLMQTLEQNNIIDLDCIDSDKYYTIIEQAKEMEKQQILNAVDGFPLDKRHLSGEDYYNEEYGKDTTDNTNL